MTSLVRFSHPEVALRLPIINSPRALACATIDDDRSPPRRVPLWSPWRGEVEEAPAAHKEVAMLLHERINRGLNEPVRLETTVAFLGAPLLLMAGIVVAHVLGLHWTVGILLGSFSWLPAYAAAERLALRRSAREIRAILLARGHCASCGYGLAGVFAGRDGLTVCPECGAAWHLGRAGRAATARGP